MANLDNLFNLMKEKGITAKQLSASTGISTGNISDWKSGRSMPTASKLIILSNYFGCSIDFILGHNISTENNSLVLIKNSLEEKNNIRLQKLIDIFDKLNTDAQIVLTDYADYLASKNKNLKNYSENNEMNA